MSVDWSAARLAYVNGSKSLAAIARQFGAQPKAAEKRAEREKWSEQRRNLSESVGRAAQTSIAEVRTDELSRFNADDLRVAKALRDQVAAHIKAAHEVGKTIPSVDLRSLSGAAEAAQRIGRLALGVSTANTGLSAPDGGPIELDAVDARSLIRAKLGLK